MNNLQTRSNAWTKQFSRMVIDLEQQVTPIISGDKNTEVGFDLNKVPLRQLLADPRVQAHIKEEISKALTRPISPAREISSRPGEISSGTGENSSSRIEVKVAEVKISRDAIVPYFDRNNIIAGSLTTIKDDAFMVKVYVPSDPTLCKFFPFGDSNIKLESKRQSVLVALHRNEPPGDSSLGEFEATLGLLDNKYVIEIPDDLVLQQGMFLTCTIIRSG